MFAETKAFSGFAVPDIEQAREFYGSTLGIKVTEEHGMLTLHLDGGDRPTLIYPKPDHEPASYTILNFQVEDVEQAVDELAARGVTMEKYEGFDQDEKGDHARPGAGHRLVQGPGRQRPRRPRGVAARPA